jgi:hypothetical protein
MNTKRLTPAQRRRLAQTPGWSPQGVGLAPELYVAALRYLFDRPVPQAQEQEWFWNIDEPEFEGTPLEWTRIQTVLDVDDQPRQEQITNERQLPLTANAAFRTRSDSSNIIPTHRRRVASETADVR